MFFSILKRRYILINILAGIVDIIFVILMFKLILEKQITIEFRLFVISLLIVIIFYELVLVRDLLFGKFTYRVLLDENGVIYFKRKEKYVLKWDEINHIEILPNKYGRLNKSSMICFNGGGLSLSRGIKDYKDFNKLFFGLQFRDSIVVEIKKYCNLPIQGIYQVAGKG